MSSSLKRIGAIFVKELQDVKTNVNISFMFFLPVLIAVVYDRIIPDMPKGMAMAFGLMFLVVMVGMYVPAMTIAEEKEKKTMEVLMLSPSTPVEVFAGKGLLTFVSIMFFSAVIFILCSGDVRHLPVILTGTVLTSIICILLGMFIGLMAHNQMATGAIGLPFYLLFIMIPIFGTLGNNFFNDIGTVLPSTYYFKMIELAYTKNFGLADMLTSIMVLVLGAVISFILVLITFRKKGIE